MRARVTLPALLAGVWCMTAGASEPVSADPAPRVTTAERLRLEFAPQAPASTPAPPGSPYTSGDVVRLPRLEVRERRIPFHERELLTPKGRLAVAKQTTLSPVYRITFGPLSWAAMVYFNPLALLTGAKPNDVEAMVLYEQNEALRRDGEIRALEDLAALAERSVAEEKRATESSFRPASRGTRGGAD